MSVALPDVNVLVALVDPGHIHHDAAHAWLASLGDREWATCPITENGLVRVVSAPAYPNRPGDAPVALAMLSSLCSGVPGHRFLPDTVSIREEISSSDVFTGAQLTDLYLLALAARNDARLVTFDRSIPTSVVTRGREALEVLTA
jgi:toxin-antitoxin system PIN domain toxin